MLSLLVLLLLMFMVSICWYDTSHLSNNKLEKKLNKKNQTFYLYRQCIQCILYQLNNTLHIYKLKHINIIGKIARTLQLIYSWIRYMDWIGNRFYNQFDDMFLSLYNSIRLIAMFTSTYTQNIVFHFIPFIFFLNCCFSSAFIQKKKRFNVFTHPNLFFPHFSRLFAAIPIVSVLIMAIDNWFWHVFPLKNKYLRFF